MNAPDVNLLIYAHSSTSPFHSKAKPYWEDALSGQEIIGIPILCVHGFVRGATGKAFGQSRVSLSEAFAIVNSWLQRPNVRILQPGPNHWQIVQQLSLAGRATGPVFTDAAIAAIALEHDAIIHTNDDHFSRFPGLRWHNPLKP